MSLIRIALADDHSTFRDITIRFLHQHEDLLVVGAANGGQEALALARNLHPDVMLVDLAMPDLPGLETIPRLRTGQPGLGIIALTLLDTDGYRQASLAAGADEFVAKANLTTDLIPAIRRVARKRLGPAQMPQDGIARPNLAEAAQPEVSPEARAATDDPAPADGYRRESVAD